MAFKPDHYPSASPYLVVDGAQASIDFLVKVFHAVCLRVIPNGNGGVAHGEVRIDDSVLMLSDAMDGWPAVASHVHIYVADVDAVYARALAAGATAVQAPMQKDDPDRRGGFCDTGGTTWWVATQMADVGGTAAR